MRAVKSVDFQVSPDLKGAGDFTQGRRSHEPKRQSEICRKEKAAGAAGSSWESQDSVEDNS